MKRILLYCSIFFAVGTAAYAQPSRIGQAGATQLLINSFSRSTGYNAINFGGVNGIESSSINPAGLSKTGKSEFVFSRCGLFTPSLGLTNGGAGININTFGYSQALKGGSVIGVAVNAYSLGEFVRTTTDQPDGTLGYFKPSFTNIGLSYAKQFTDHIAVGATLRIINEANDQISSQGVAFDAGVQYRTGLSETDGHPERIKFGVSLRNVGPSMQYGGDGLLNRVYLESNNPYTSGVLLPSEKFELPSVLNLGGSYDWYIGNDHTFTLLAGFISNSFYYNQTGVGAEYKFKDYLALRSGFLYEKGIFSNQRYSSFTGAAFGVTVQVPFKTGKVDDAGNPVYSTVSIDGSYRTSSPLPGTSCLGVRVNL